MIEPNANQENVTQKNNVENVNIPQQEVKEVTAENQAAIADNVAAETPVNIVSTAPVDPIDPLATDDTLTAEEEKEVIEEFSGQTDDSGTWTKKAKDVIDQYADKPYVEEEKSEELQAAYLKQRFGIDVKRDEN